MTRAEAHAAFAQQKCKELIEEETCIRKAVFLSQREVSEAIGLSSHGNLSLVEKHKAVPTLDRFLRILSALGYTLKIVPK